MQKQRQGSLRPFSTTYKPCQSHSWDRDFIYRKPGTKGQPYDIISLGADGREGGEGFDEDLWNSDANKR